MGFDGDLYTVMHTQSSYIPSIRLYWRGLGSYRRLPSRNPSSPGKKHAYALKAAATAPKPVM